MVAVASSGNAQEMMQMTTSHRRLCRYGGAILGAFAIAGAAAAADLAPQTRANLDAAMHGEAYANLKYRAFADAARQRGNEKLAALFEEAANVESSEHFAREAGALGLAGNDTRNLADSMSGEHYENTKMYIDFADQADKAGDRKVAAMFRQIAADEGDHYQQFKEALAEATRQGSSAGGEAAGAREDRE
jgi:rubrerythrin